MGDRGGRQGNKGAIGAAATYLEIDPRLVNAAVGYYGSNSEEIDDWIARTDALGAREEAKWRAAQRALSA